MTRDKELIKLQKIARHYDIGIRFGTEPRYINTYKPGSVYRAYIEIDLRMSEVIFRPDSGRKGLNNRIARAVAHDLGHFLVAAKGRRYRKDFGIPSEDRRSEASEDYWNLDEYKAQLVDNYILELCGFGKRFRLPKNPLWRGCRRGYPMARKAVRWWDTVGKDLIQKELSFL